MLLKSAEIGGALKCGGCFRNANGVALSAEAAKIGGAVFLHDNFKSEGEVLLSGAEIGGALNCDGGSFENAKRMALSAYGAKIGGDVFLGNKNQCKGQVLLDGAEIRGALNCDRGVFENAEGVTLSAQGAKIGGDVFLGNKDQSKGQVLLHRAENRGALSCDGDNFKNANGFRSEGKVLLDRAEILGPLNCTGGVFRNANGAALSAQGAKIGGDVLLCESRCKGEVLLTHAEIGGALNCDGSFENANRVALRAEAAKIRGAVCLHKNFKSEGEVLLGRAEIGGALNCDGGSFKNVKRWVSANNPVALSAYGAKIGGDVFLGNKNRSAGQVQLDRAEIRGALNCAGGVFKNANGAALSALGAKIGGDVCLKNNFKSDGEVMLDRAEIGGALHCDGGTFKNANGSALNANYTKIGRDVILEFAVKGKIFLEGASIAGDLTLSSTRIDEACPAPAIDAFLGLQRADIRGALDLRRMPKNARTTVDLSDTSCTVFRKAALIPPEKRELKQWLMQLMQKLQQWPMQLMQKLQRWPMQLRQRLQQWPMQLRQKLKQWPMQLMQKLQQKFGQKPKQELEHELELHGFVYRRIESREPLKTQLEWLGKQLGAKKKGGKEYRPQPYRQFANSLRTHGHDAEARACLISMAKDRRIRANLSWPSRAWQWALWHTIRNGHAPLRALYFLLGLWAIGFVAFGWGYQKHVMEPSDRYAYQSFAHGKSVPGQYDPFCALVYAVDLILPIISLGQRDRWHPRAPPTTIAQTTAAQTTAPQTALKQLHNLKSTDRYMASSARRASQ